MPTVIVSEQHGDWALALRRELAAKTPRVGPPVKLLETRSLWECRQRLLEQRPALLVLELGRSEADELLEFVAELAASAAPPVAVVAQRRWASHEWLVRELGAVYFQAGCRSASRLAELAMRGVQNLADESAEPAGAVEAIWSRLPWPARGGAHDH